MSETKTNSECDCVVFSLFFFFYRLHIFLPCHCNEIELICHIVQVVQLIRWIYSNKRTFSDNFESSNQALTQTLVGLSQTDSDWLMLGYGHNRVYVLVQDISWHARTHVALEACGHYAACVVIWK